MTSLLPTLTEPPHLHAGIRSAEPKPAPEPEPSGRSFVDALADAERTTKSEAKENVREDHAPRVEDREIRPEGEAERSSTESASSKSEDETAEIRRESESSGAEHEAVDSSQAPRSDQPATAAPTDSGAPDAPVPPTAHPSAAVAQELPGQRTGSGDAPPTDHPDGTADAPRLRVDGLGPIAATSASPATSPQHIDVAANQSNDVQPEPVDDHHPAGDARARRDPPETHVADRGRAREELSPRPDHAAVLKVETVRPQSGPSARAAEPVTEAPQPSNVQARAVGIDPGRSDASTDDDHTGSRQHRSDGRSLPNITPPSAPTPATARAMQVDAAIKIEQLAQAAGEVDAAARPNHGLQVTAPTLREDLRSTSETVDRLFLARTAGSENDAFSSRIVRGLSAMVNQRGGVMHMKLSPPELGSLRVQMTMAQGTVSANFIAGTEQAHALLERNLAVLRTALESHGLTVEKLGVQMTNSEQSGATARHESGTQDQSQSQQQSNRHDAGQGQSRGRRDGDPNTAPQPRAAARPRAFTLDPSQRAPAMSEGEPS
jgi:flagellar hook-length control protein FliK